MAKQHKPSSSSSSQKPKNFPIPDLKTLLQHYDAPEPIIYPPGSEPTTSLNPNQDKVCGLTPISPMDIDPCVIVATCCEIFSKTTDLTASEHAGVSLTEHSANIESQIVSHHDEFKPMDVDSHVVIEPVTTEEIGNSIESDVVSTNIESNVLVAAKTESDVVVSKEVENGVVARHIIESQTAGFIVCDVCNLTLNSEKTLEIHKLGKAHLKKSKMVQVSSSTKQEPPSPYTNGFLDQESEKQNQNSLQKEEASVDSLFFCSIPDLDCSNQKIQFVATEESTVPIYKPVENLKSKENRIIGDSDESKKKQLKKGSVCCELCQICCSSIEGLREHISGKKHQKNLKKSETVFGLSPAPSLHDLRNEESKVVVLESSKRKDANVSDVDVNAKRQKVSEEEGESGVRVSCRVCNVVCNGTMAFKSHLASDEHIEMALKQAKV